MSPLLCRIAFLVAAALLLAACPTPEEPDEADPTPQERPAPTPAPTPAEPTPTPPDDEGAWEELPDAPVATRLNHSVTWADDLVIVWGGEDQETFEIAADGAAFDPATGEWQDVPAAPIEGRWAHEAVWTGDGLFVWGGTAGPDHLAACFTDGALYDPATGEWEAVPDAPGEARCDASVAWTGEELLVFGGHAAEGPPGPGDRHDDGVAFDPSAGEWRPIPAGPLGPRAGGAAAWVGGEFVVYGGHGEGEPDGFGHESDGAAYDPDADEWREIAASPLPPLSGITSVAADGELLVLGGQDPGADDQDHSTAAAGYDPEADAWRDLADLPGPQTTLEAVWTGDVVYLLGGGAPITPEEEEAGETPEPNRPFIAYVVADDAWVERPDPPGGPRTHHGMAWTGADLVVWGGQGAGDEDVPPGLRWDPPG